MLKAFWQEVAALADPLHRSGLASVAIGSAGQLASPYQINPFDINPLRELLERLVDFERLCAERSLRLLIATTALRTGKSPPVHQPMGTAARVDPVVGAGQ